MSYKNRVGYRRLIHIKEHTERAIDELQWNLTMIEEGLKEEMERFRKTDDTTKPLTDDTCNNQ